MNIEDNVCNTLRGNGFFVLKKFILKQYLDLLFFGVSDPDPLINSAPWICIQGQKHILFLSFFFILLNTFSKFYSNKSDIL